MESISCIPYGKLLFDQGNQVIAWDSKLTKRKLLLALLVEVIHQEKHPTILYNEHDEDLINDLVSNQWNLDSDQSVDLIKEALEPSTVAALLSKVKNRQDIDKKRRLFHENRGRTIFGDHNFEDLLEMNLKLKQVFTPDEMRASLHSEDYDYSHSEYNQKLAEIERASQLFQSSFTFLDTHNVFNDNIFINKEGAFSTSILLKYLSNFQSKAQLLIRSFGEFLNKVHDNKTEEISAVIKQQHSAVESVRFRHAHSTEHWKKKQQKQLTTIIQQLYSDFNVVFEKDLNCAPIVNREDAEKQLANLSQLIEQQYNTIHQRVRSYKKSINIRSISDSFVGKIEKEIESLVKSINDSAIFHTEVENNSISLWKQFLNLKEISGRISMAQNQLMNMGDYYDWKAFFIQLPHSTRSIIECLRGLATQDWIPAFQSWFLDQVEKESSRKTPILPEDDETETTLSEVLAYNRLKTLLKAQQNNPDIVSQITKGKKKLKDLFDTHTIEKLQGFQIEKRVDFTYSDRLVIDLTGQFTGAESHYSFSANPCKLGHAETLPMTHHVEQPLNKIAIDKKLELAGLLSAQLYHKAEFLECYLSKNANIIIDVSEWKKELIKSEMSFSGFREIRLLAAPKKAITEFLLNDSERCYYIYDHRYSNAADAANFYKKTQILSCIESAGYQLIFIDIEQMKIDDFYLSDLLTQIKA